MGAIDAYVHALGGALSGPHRLKADVLAEVRSGLDDAAEAYHDKGFSDAEDRAVADFGPVRDLAPAFQAELGLSQGRRTALLVVATLAPQAVVWHLNALAAPRPEAQPLLQQAVEWSGGLAMAAALAAFALSHSRGVRPQLARLTGVLAVVVATFFATTGPLLTVLNSGADNPLWSVTGLPWTVAFLLLPMALVGRSASRCLAAAP